MIKHSQQIGVIANAHNYISDPSVENEIIKYISPYFHLDQNTIKLDTTVKNNTP